MIKTVITILLLLPLAVYAQFTKLKTVNVSEAIASASVDRPGDLYLLSVTGQFQKFDKEGAVQIIHKNNPAPDLFEPRDGTKLFTFYRATRQYAYLGPSFNFLYNYVVDSSFVIDPWLICPSGDYNVWIIDAADRSLKKINTKLGKVEADIKLETSLPVIDILYMREYQGFLFALSRTRGILIFNGIGKLLKIIGTPGLLYFNFLGEELYYEANGDLIFFDLFSAETRTINLPGPGNVALLTDERLYLVHEKSVGLFVFKP